MADPRKVVVKFFSAMEHDTPEAMAKHLHDHPLADHKNHTVKKPGQKRTKGEPGAPLPAKARAHTELTGILKTPTGSSA